MRAFVLGFALGCGLVCGKSAAAAIDLVAIALSGPTVVHAGSTVTVLRDVEALGSQGSAESAASSDLVCHYRSGGVEIAVTTGTTFGLVAESVTIPEDFPTGIHPWELVVDPLVGETELGNNSVIGGDLVVLPPLPTLCVSPVAPVHVFVAIGATEEPAPITFSLGQCIPTPLLASWYATLDGAPPWLELSALGGVLDDGRTTTTQLTFHALELPGAPVHLETVLRFWLLTQAAPIVEIPITLEIANARFEPGDALVGVLESSGETDTAEFAAIAGMQLRVTRDAASATLPLHLTIQDDAGLTVGSTDFKSGKSGKASFPLHASGTFRLVVSASPSAAGATGAWSLKTSRKLQKSATGSKKKFFTTNPLATQPAPIQFTALAGTTLSARFKPSIYIDGVYSIVLEHPDSTSTEPLLAFDATTASLVLPTFVLPQTGAYRIAFYAALPKPEKVTAKIVLTPPVAGSSTLSIP